MLKNRQDIKQRMKELEDQQGKVKLSFREFVEICLAQYRILLPISFGITGVFFLVLLFITKILYRG